MDIYLSLSICISLAIAFTYINARYIKMQTTSAIMVGSIALSLIVVVLDKLGISRYDIQMEHLLISLDFHNLLINGMLSFLLFAGGLTINWHEFKQQRWEIFTLSIFSTLASALLIAAAIYYLLNWFGVNISFEYCMLFGALISPTDPIAVLAMLADLRAPKKLEVIIAGESLFNDGVGIVIFLTAYQVVFADHSPTVHGTLLLFIRQSLGGIGYGILLALLCIYLIRTVKDIKLHILLTIGLTTGGYALAHYLGISGPLAMVVAGIMIGNAYRRLNPDPQQLLYDFWEIVDELLNAILFLLIGFEILVMRHHADQIIVCMLAIPLVLVVRAITVIIPMQYFRKNNQYPRYTRSILIWGGLRGGLAVALALSLPHSDNRDLILSMTYAIVLFAILIQGTTIKALVKRSIYK
jgi:CPA1 family monovalent cation:H+ antiporter